MARARRSRWVLWGAAVVVAVGLLLLMRETANDRAAAVVADAGTGVAGDLGAGKAGAESGALDRPSLDVPVPPVLREGGAEGMDPEQMCAEVTALLDEQDFDDFADTVLEPYPFGEPVGEFFWIPLGEVGVAVPRRDYRILLMPVSRATDEEPDGQPSASLGLKSEDGIGVLILPDAVHVAMDGLVGFDDGVTALDVFRSGLEMARSEYSCDPDEPVRSAQVAIALLFKSLLSPMGRGPGRAFADVGTPGSVLAMRDDGETMAVRHVLAAGGGSWAVTYKVQGDRAANQMLSLAQLNRPGEPPAGAAPLPEDLALAARVVTGDRDAIRSWIDRNDTDEWTEARFLEMLE